MRGYMDTFFDFNIYEESANYYGGSDEKYSIVIDGNDYMLKFPGIIEENNSLNSSYSNNIFSEYIACKIIASIGLPVQEVLLGEYNGKPAVACKDFTTDFKRLVEFSKIENRVIQSKDRGRTPKLENLEKIFLSNAFKHGFGNEAKARYWDIFIIDALIGNFDRHSGNWGYLIDKHTKIMTNAPIYDCGSSLYPQLADDSIEKILSSETEITKRIDLFPKAALTINGDKLSFKDYIGNLSNPDCNAALKRIVPEISLDAINKIIENTPNISSIRRTFYKTMLERRYQEILRKPFSYLPLSP